MPSPSPSLSVVIPTKDSGRTLARSLASLQAQTTPPLETIVVDNFSTDDTVEIAERYGATVYKQGSERSEQRNYGARRARGDLTLFLDSDMLLAAAGVVECTQALEHHDAVLLTEDSFGEGFWARCKWLERRCYEGETTIEAARGFWRTLLTALGGHDEALFAFEDWDLHHRCAAAGYRIGRAGPGQTLSSTTKAV